MKRKINRVGPATYTVSLPKKWVEKQKLKKGDDIEVDEKGSTIVVSTSKKPEAKKVKAHVPFHKRTILRTLYHSYKSGADEVELSFDEKDCIRLIEENMDRFLGFEIIEQNDNSVLIKNITEVNEKDFEKTFKRLFEITLYLARKTYENFSQGHFDSLSNTALIEKTQNKLYLFCLRALNMYKESLKDLPTLYYLLAQRLEDIGDSYKYICEHYGSNKPKKISKDSLDLLSDVNKLLNFMYDMHYNFDLEKNVGLSDMHHSLKEKAQSLLLSQPKEEIFLISKMEKLIVDILDASSPVFGINFEKMGMK